MDVPGYSGTLATASTTDTAIRIYYFYFHHLLVLQISIALSVAVDHQTTRNELILEDSIEDTETLPGSGSANILASGGKCQPIDRKEEQKRMRNNPKIQRQEVPNKFHVPEQKESSDANIKEVNY